LNPLKNLYQWVLSWAESAYGVLILFCVSFAESSFFPVPADPLLIALAIGNTKKSFYYAFMCTLGSVVGGIFGYMIGYFLWWTSPGEYSSVAEFFFNIVPGFTTEVFDNIKIRYETYNFIVIFTAAFTPIPYKVFSISAGAFSINLPIFIIASILGRGLRFYMISTLVWFFGDTIKAMLDKYFSLFIIILTIIFCLSYFLIGYLF
jgi:membrane protein YqaA with SNARE-associated domain